MTDLQIAPHYDVIIVGARCAGAATAMLLARRGARVLLVDRERGLTDTLSTHALMRGAVMQLSKWGTLDRIAAAGTPPIRNTSFTYGEETLNLDIKASHGVTALYAPRRMVLDGALADNAAAAGADLRYGVSVTGVARGRNNRVTGAILRDDTGTTRTVFCDLLIGADGRRSTVARLVEAATEKLSRNASASAYRYFGGVADRGNRWYYSHGFAAGVIPTNDGQSCVFVSVPQYRFMTEMRGRLDDGILTSIRATFPALAAELDAAQPIGRAVGFSGQKGHFRTAAGPGWALVGDAGYFKDPLTAHGITDALRDAEILADAAAGGRARDLKAYQATRDALSAELFAATDDIAGFDWSLETLQDLHMSLNTAMKAEQDWMYGRQDSLRLAS